MAKYFFLKFDEIDIENLKNTVNQPELIDIYTKYHSQNSRINIFSRAHKTFTKINHIKQVSINSVGLKSYRECCLTTTESEIINRKTSGKLSNIMKLNDTSQNNPWVKEEGTMEIRKYID